MQHSAAIASFIAVLALSGCSTLDAPTGPIPEDLSQLQQWRARGRIGVSNAEDGGSGSFEWQQRGERANVTIRGPLGIGNVRLQVAGSAENPNVRLETGAGKVLEDEDAWSELEARLGAPVPAGQLRFWMLGIPAPGEHRWVERTDEAATLEQGGWRIDYQRFTSEPGARVPLRIRAVSGAARVRIVMDRWQLGGS